ncbi:MAG TPA: NUDIX domain-containing protein [Caulobacteraceae bacterium]|nr:NUDIX domain-containing protein [Caulobacteraceae bacterium]
MRERLTVRVLLLDPAGRILLMKGRLPSDPAAPGAWFTLGGGVEPGETPPQAAAREIAEETGFTGVEIGSVIGRGEQIHHDRKGREILVRETFLLARCPGGEPSRAGWQPLEHEFVDDIRWWTLADLAACEEPVFPADLANMLAEAIQNTR